MLFFLCVNFLWRIFFDLLGQKRLNKMTGQVTDNKKSEKDNITNNSAEGTEERESFHTYALNSTSSIKIFFFNNSFPYILSLQPTPM
jgi:hypothetical protein